MNTIQNEFLGGTSAIVVETQEQFNKLKEFMGMKNLFLSDGTPAGSMNMMIDGKRVAFYTSAIVVETQEQFNKLKEFMGMKNLFLSDGTPAGSMNMMIDGKRVAFYRDVIGMYVVYSHPADCDGYKICEFKDAFSEQSTEQRVEQRSLFGGDDAPGIKQPDEDLVVGPMEADYKEVENEISLKEALNQLTIGTVTHAKCDGNLLEFKDKVIDVINKKENLVITRDNFVESKEVNQLTIGTVTHAKCDGNLLEFKDKVIDVINKKENLVITRDNFVESKEVVTDLNTKAKTLKEQRALFNKEVKKFTDPYSSAFSEVINAIENVANKLKSNIKVFEDEEKEELKKKIYETQFNPMLQMLVSKEMITEEISQKFEFKESWLNKSSFTKTGDFVKKYETQFNPMLQMLVSKEMITEEISQKFEFKESWLNKSSFTKTGDFVKKIKDEINAEFERLCKMYESEKKDIETIQSTIKQLSLAHNLDTELNADTYIALYKSGVPMPQINERINQDIATIKKAVDKQVEKAQEQIQHQQVEQQPIEQETADTSNLTILEDEKTGEVLAKGNEHQVLAMVAKTPKHHEGKVWEYTYTFKGTYGPIKTFSNILKLLSKMFPDFEYKTLK